MKTSADEMESPIGDSKLWELSSILILKSLLYFLVLTTKLG